MNTRVKLLVLLFCAFSLFPAKGHCATESTVKIAGHEFSVFSSSPLDRPQKKIKRVVFVIHGTLRNAKDYFDYVSHAAADAKSQEETLIVAPHFKTESDVRRPNELYWDGGDWKYGYPSVSSGISSYTVLDDLIREVHDSGYFPNLESIVVTGHSAGGQFTNRYAIANPLPDSINKKILYVVANPSSYLYLTEDRPKKGSVSEFEVPKSPCTDYNHYIYGLKTPAPYLAQSSEAQLRKNAETRRIVLFLGALDKESEYLDQSCEAMLQGKNRWERGQAYERYIQLFFPENSTRLLAVPGVGHDGERMYNSFQGQSLLFGKASDGPLHKAVIREQIGSHGKP